MIARVARIRCGVLSSTDRIQWTVTAENSEPFRCCGAGRAIAFGLSCWNVGEKFVQEGIVPAGSFEF